MVSSEGTENSGHCVFVSSSSSCPRILHFANLQIAEVGQGSNAKSYSPGELKLI